MEKHPLSDLSFFRFPELTPEVVRNIVLLFLLLILTVAVTVWVQHRITEWVRTRSRRRTFERVSSELHMPAPAREVLVRLNELAGAKNEFDLVKNAQAFEEAVERLISETGGEAVESPLGHLRRALHLNVMNPDLELVCTRQLLQDLPVRLIVNIGEERLDLYCSLMKVTEETLLFDMPQAEDVLTLLRNNPDALLIFWREKEGETVFRIRLEPIEGQAIPLFRADHAFRDRDMAQRADFRLTTDLPLHFQFIASHDALARKRKQPAPAPLTGEGRLVDLSYGGASLVAPQPLAVGGFAQLNFKLHGHPLRMMLEVLSERPTGGGDYLVHGRFPVHADETGNLLRKMLVREQIKRLRDKDLLHFRPGA